jgi:heme/copper-type cytochrome/quinol oxidase subunit 3
MIPYTTERRADTGVTNVTLGIWLFLASEVMLFGALFSAYALLRVSATDWPAPRTILSTADAVWLTAILLSLTSSIWSAATQSTKSQHFRVIIATMFALGFVAMKCTQYYGHVSQGLLPSTSMFLALYFTLTGFHTLHVLAGAVANLWVANGIWKVDETLSAGRLRALAMYWTFVDIVWVVILGLFYVA